MTPEVLKHMEIFHPYTIERINRVKKKKIRFVHYTTAESAFNIIKNREVWMRKSSLMNDFMEVDHGFACLNSAYKSEDVGKAFKGIIEKLHEGLTGEIETLFNGWWPILQSGSYLVSFSEHDDNEDKMGRLSMWRAYGSVGGVGLVMNHEAFFSESDALKAYTNPVAYLNEEGFKEKFEQITRLISDNSAYLRSYTREQLRDSIFLAFKFAVLCTKHPGFKEEREWRVVYIPNEKRSPHILEALVTVEGIPQHVQKIPLKNIPEEGLLGVEIPQLLSRVIIGPTNYSVALYEAFVEALTAAGVSDAGAKVWASDIPIRR